LFEIGDPRYQSANPTVNLWNLLLARGFPYIKAEVLRLLMPPRSWALARGFINDPLMVNMMEDYMATHVEVAARAG
jgi:hypothetical protein